VALKAANGRFCCQIAQSCTDGSHCIDGNAGETPLNRREVGGNLAFDRPLPGEMTPMGALFPDHFLRARRMGLTLLTAAAIAWPALTSPAAARGPDSIADVAEQVIDAVVNISTKQKVDMNAGTMPQLPPGSPFE
jgi:hypothetical protein